MHGDDALWTLESQLLAHIGDVLAAANWQRAGDKRAQKPKPIPRPGVRDKAGTGKSRYGRPAVDEATRQQMIERIIATQPQPVPELESVELPESEGVIAHG